MNRVQNWMCGLGLAVATLGAQAAVGLWENVGIQGGNVLRVEYIDNGVALAITSWGVYRTTNHGASWTRSRTSSPNPLPPAIAVNPANRSQVLMSSDFLMRSTDGGVSFTGVQVGGSFSAGRMPGFSRNGSYAWVFENETGLAWRSSDAGNTWTPVAPLPAGFHWWTFDADLVDRNTVYVAAGNRGFVSRDAGASWTEVAPASMYLFMASRTTSGAALAIDYTAGIVPSRSTDFGATWQRQGGPLDLRAIATGTGAHAIASTYANRILLSNDDGQSWADSGRFPGNTPVYLSYDPTNANRILAATGAGIIGSDDGGLTWTERNTGILDARVFDIAVTRDGSNALYLSTLDLATIYRRDATSGEYTGVAHAASAQLEFGGEPYEVDIEVSSQDGRTLYVMRDQKLGRSTDGGASWTRLPDLPQAPRSLLIDPADPLVLYVIAGYGGLDRTVLRSTNGGQDWVRTGIPAEVVQLFFDNASPANLYALGYDYLGASGPVYRSTNGGITWTALGWDATAYPEFTPYNLVFEPGNPSTMYLAMGQGLFKSTDSGSSWTRLQFLPAYPLALASDVIVDPQAPSIVYVAAGTPSPHRSVDGGATWYPVVLPAANADNGRDFAFERIVLVPGHNARLVGVRADGGVYEMDVPARLGLSRAPATLTTGTGTSLTLTLRNEGHLPATRLRLAGTLPASSTTYSLSASTGTCAVTARDLACDVGTLAPQGSMTLTVGLTPTTVENSTFTVTSYEALTPDSQSRVQVAVSAPSAVPAPAAGGGGGGRLDYLLALVLALAMAFRPLPHRGRFQ